MAARVTGEGLLVRDLLIRRGSRTIIAGASFAVGPGELVALMGPSGSGKTTMLRAVAGLEPFAAGEVEVGGVRLEANGALRAAARRALHARVGMVFQFHHLFPHMTALQNVWLAPVHVQQMPRAAAEARALALLDMLGVGDAAAALPHELSGGEAQRVAIARALAVDPPVLLMDEPTASLDAGRRAELASTLRGLTGQGRAVVVATHDEAFARACARRVIKLEDGRLAAGD